MADQGEKTGRQASFAGSRGDASKPEAPLPAEPGITFREAWRTEGLGPRLKALIGWLMGTRLVRSFQHYAVKRGPILASGLAYQALFALFAGLWFLFSVAGLVLAGNAELRGSLVDAVSGAVPGLIGTDPDALINPDDLLGASTTLNLLGIIALLGVLFTTLGFLNSARDGIRDMFDLPQVQANPVLLRVKDLGFLIGFLVVVLLSTALSVIGTTATGFTLGLVGVDEDSVAGNIVGRLVTFVVIAGIDTFIVGAMMRMLAQVAIPWGQLRGGALIGGVGAAVLTVAFQLGVIGGASSNPLLASFVAILGLLVFFNFLCQVLLVASSWTATTLSDQGVVVDEAVEAARLEAARRLVAEHDGPVVEGGFLGRLFRRRPKARVD